MASLTPAAAAMSLVFVPLKPLLGEAFDGYPQKLPAAVFAGHAGGAGGRLGGLGWDAGIGTASISKYSLLLAKP